MNGPGPAHVNPQRLTCFAQCKIRIAVKFDMVVKSEAGQKKFFFLKSEDRNVKVSMAPDKHLGSDRSIYAPDDSFD